jgi:flagellar protein FliO/FliZ
VSTLSAPASPISIGSLTQLTLSLLAIVGLILAVSWALRRLKVAGPRGRGEIAVLDELALGPRERVVLVQVGDAQVLLGVAAGSIVGLTPLAAPLNLRPPASVAPFGERLRELMRRPGSGA